MIVKPYSHSPGPWVEHTDDDGNLYVDMGDGHKVYIGNMEETCGVCHANATLITAAPMLLESLRELSSLLVDMTTRPDLTITQAEIGARLDKAQAAIDKADPQPHTWVDKDYTALP